MEDATTAQALVRYLYWLQSTGSRRLAASLANRETGLSFSTGEYEKLANKKPPLVLEAQGTARGMLGQADT